MRFLNALFVVLAVASASHAYSQASAITIDADFSDWTPDLPGVVDTPEAIAGIDILEFQVSNDADFLFIRVKLADEIDLTENLIPHNLRLFIDADNDPGTGYAVQAGYGSELGVVFRDRFAYYDVVPSSTVGFTDIQLRPAPTVSGTEFELAIGRNVIPDGSNPLFPSSTIRILWLENNGGDRCPNTGEVFSYTFDDSPMVMPDPTPLERIDPTHLRIITYNTLGNGITNAARQASFERILQAAEPDVIAFQEVSGVSVAQAKSLLDQWLPSSDPNGWYVTKDDYDLITASIYPVVDEWPGLNRQFPVLIDLPNTYTSDLLVVNSHLSCCSNNAGRQDQVDGYTAWLADAMTLGGAVDLPLNVPVVYLGDLNLVGYAQQLTTLLTGDIVDEATYGADFAPDWDGSPVSETPGIQSDKRMHYTWRDDPANDFPPGKLDFIIYTDAVLDLERSYVIQTEVMPADRLALYGLLQNDCSTASDHFPSVADFSIAQLSDIDADGIIDEADNCIDTPNTDQADWNSNGVGDACEDSDGDGLSDADELLNFGTDPSNDDSDNDQLSDGFEVSSSGTNPLLQDTDGDGMTDWLELDEGFNPLLTDSDNDGCVDPLEYSLQCGNLPNCEGDVNGDLLVNTSDLLLLLGNYGVICQ